MGRGTCSLASLSIVDAMAVSGPAKGILGDGMPQFENRPLEAALYVHRCTYNEPKHIEILHLPAASPDERYTRAFSFESDSAHVGRTQLALSAVEGSAP